MGAVLLLRGLLKHTAFAVEAPVEPEPKVPKRSGAMEHSDLRCSLALGLANRRAPPDLHFEDIHHSIGFVHINKLKISH